MKHSAKFIRSDRRSFLKGAAVAGGAAAVAAPVAAVIKPVDSGLPAAIDTKAPHKGYEENDYVRGYYDLARF